MPEKTIASATTEEGDGYARFEDLIRDRVAGAAGPLFETSGPNNLWSGYLNSFPWNQQHYNCSACRRFIERYGGLVTIDPIIGETTPLLWSSDLAKVPTFFIGPVSFLYTRVQTAVVTGVFLSSEPIWGTPLAGGWTHLSGRNPAIYHRATETAEQAMARHREEYAMLSRGLAEYPQAAVEQAVRVLQADALDRSEKTLGVAEWLLRLHQRTSGVKGPRKNNIVWAAVAAGPSAWCHVRSTMIHTLLDDLVAGLPYESISKRWAEKMHPAQYQRPSAPPSVGAIEAAEKLFEQTGAARALERRYARLEDVLAFLWRPRQPAAAGVPEEGKEGLFSHLRPVADRSQVQPVQLPPRAITWVRFLETVLPTAIAMDAWVPRHGGFYGLVTAAVEAPAIIQWDGLEGHPRNPVSSYVYIGGSQAIRWGLVPEWWAQVTAVFRGPHHWQAPLQFPHHADVAMFALVGAKDSGVLDSGAALFPEIMRSEYHGIRKVIEAHSKRAKLTGLEEASANGILIGSHSLHSRGALRVRVHTSPREFADYDIDRWE